MTPPRQGGAVEGAPLVWSIALPDPARPLANLIEPLLTQPDVAKILGVSVRFVQRHRSASTFKAPDAWCGRLPRWKTSTILDWIEREGRDEHHRQDFGTS